MEDVGTTTTITMENGDEIPIVVVYNDDETYGDSTGVNYDKLTYELLLKEDKKSKFTVTKTRPKGPIDRILTDVFGLVFLYGLTFVLCDLYRTWKKGRWTSLMWMFLGPWNVVTGSPILHKITSLFDAVDSRSYAVSRCQSKYATAQKECKAKFPFEGSLDDCMFTAEVNYQTCMENTPDFQQCQRQSEESTDYSTGVGRYCDQQGDENPTCYPIHTGSDFLETQECLRAVGYDGVYYGPQ